MFWLVIAIIAVVVVYKILSNDIRKTSNLIGRKLNIKPTIVTSAITQMQQDASASVKGISRQRMFCQMVANTGNDESYLEDYIKVIFIYQILKNSHEENVKWWVSRIVESGISPKILGRDKSNFETFYNVNHSEFSAFIEAYNKKFGDFCIKHPKASYRSESDEERPCTNCGELTNKVIGGFYLCEKCTL